MKIAKLLKENGIRRTCGVLCNYAEYSLHRRHVFSFPSAIDIEVTSRCPLACMHCPRTHREALGLEFPIGDMDRAKGLELIRSLRGVRRIAFQGYGEPLIYPHIFEFLAEARQSRIFTAFSTSAAVVNDKMLAGLKECPPDLLTFSCDAVNMRYDDGVRENLNIEHYQDNVAAIIDAVRSSAKPVEILFHTCIVGDNYKYLDDIVAFAAKQGVKTLDISELNISFLEKWLDRLLPQDKELMMTAVDKAKETGAERGVTVGFTPQYVAQDKKKVNCRYLWQHPFITWQGELTPCCGRPFASQFTLGNVFDKGFYALWNSEQIKQMRHDIANLNCPDICRGCPYAP
jgi:radical SAM protein with 4Fe4S-binding SPASM domain